MPTVSVLHILRTIKDRSSIARTELQQLTGLSWGTITNTTRELLKRHLIVEEGAVSSKAGRKPMRLALNRNGPFLIGLDIASERVRCLIMNLAGEILWRDEARGAEGDVPEAVLQRSAGLVVRGLAEAQVGGRNCLGMGVAVPGSLDRARGALRFAPRLAGWCDVPLLGTLRGHVRDMQGPIELEQEANCLAVAERWFGVGGEVQHLLCIHLGESVGLGILLGGDIFRGSQELAGEFGHTTLDPDGPACICGDRGCVEAYCSVSALLSYARSVAGAGDDASKVRTMEELVELAEKKDGAALAAFGRMGERLGVGAANLIDLFNPEMVVLAGRCVVAKDHFMPTLEAQMKAHAGRYSTQRLVVSELGAWAAAMGACGIVLEQSFAQVNSETTAAEVA